MLTKISGGYEFCHGAVSCTVIFLSGHLILCGTIGQQIFVVPDNTKLEDLPELFPNNRSIVNSATLYTDTVINRKRYADEVDRLYREKIFDDQVRLSLLDVFYLCNCGSMILKKKLKEAGLDKWTDKMEFEEMQPALLAHIGVMQLLIREITNEKTTNQAERRGQESDQT